ncbi:cytochrome c biogenesis protein CcsA [Tissierella sp. MB52-C2]|uniref:cytochrome c biogenesis protein CcsA n=1 Tax=Tissierella sp. MB52-C2 TaxID=3070999 RepID=UPI0035AC0801
MLSYRAISLGFLLLTLVIITGAIWVESAWGRYWVWRGKRAALFSVIGFICVLFTYIGVNTLLSSIHSYVM